MSRGRARREGEVGQVRRREEGKEGIVSYVCLHELCVRRRSFWVMVGV
jgi:hypothetical protein